MLQKRLNSLAMCRIENDILDDINLDRVIKDFAPRNAGRQFLQGTKVLYFYLGNYSCYCF